MIYASKASKVLTADEIRAVLRDHAAWLARVRTGDGRANLRDAYLNRAYLRGASLIGAKGRPSSWPAPTMVLLATWGPVSDALCVDLMRYDAANHPRPKAFHRWAETGTCPYGDDCGVERAANFIERCSLWTKDALRKRPKSAYSLMQRLIAEKMGPA